MRLRELMASALSASRNREVNLRTWEGHLTDGCNELFGGQDIFDSCCGGIEGGCILLTVVERDSVLIHAYGGDVLPVSEYDAPRRYPVIGYGVFMRCVRGDHGEVRKMIEDEYRSIIGGMNVGEFHERYGKLIPYHAATDEDLFDFSRGVVDVLEDNGTESAPLTLLVNNDHRLKPGSYHDLRRFDTIAELFDGVVDVWTAIVSSDLDDRELFIDRTKNAFIDRMEGEMPF